MKLAMIGSGYVGLCTGIGFAAKGHDVTCVDTDAPKVSMINRGEVPFYEKGLQENLRKFLRKKTFRAKVGMRDVPAVDAVFVCVGTPADKKGRIDLSYVAAAAQETGNYLASIPSYCVVVVKSTVVPGTTESVVVPALEKHSGKKIGQFGVCSSPEFLKEGKALDDFMHPNYVVIGESDKKSGNVLKKLYAGFRAPVIRTNIRTAEMIKYAANAFLATKISFINEIGNMCRQRGIDAYTVADAIGNDKRIGRLFLDAGCGFGGSCFTKDLSALISSADAYDPRLLEEVLQLNIRQRKRIVDMLKGKMQLKNKRIAVLGLSFKPDTDDIRDAAAVDVIQYLRDEGAQVVAYDPKAMENTRKVHPDITYADSAREALAGADACLILTEWDEFKKLGEKDFASMKNRIIVEGRRVLSGVAGSEGICW
ncbi:MAG: UDP-glucose/GDP-mannose dehydrogenase family protein [Candidatus Aenigmarchaeota archaeon]|nr:UDP-glucose/GDP-mannose dehydrogenase family protein [Candidatus Aenigmarchaeota archaeon]